MAVQNALDYLTGNKNLKNTLAYQDIRNQIASKSAPDLKSKETSAQKPDLKSKEKPKAEPKNVSAKDVDEAVDEFNDLLQQFSGKIQFSFVSPEVNQKFNEELKQYDQLDIGHIFKLGSPSQLLQDYGIPNESIELSKRVIESKSQDPAHPFSPQELQGLPNAIQKPLAIFKYNDPSKYNLIIDLTTDDKNFLVGIQINSTYRGVSVNDIRGLFPKDTAGWLHWIQEDKALYLDKNKVQEMIAQSGTNLLKVGYLDLDSVNKIVQNFDNASHKVKKSPNNTQFSFVPANNRNEDIDVSKLSPEKVSIFSKLVTAGAKLGYRLIQRGNTDFAQWREAWLDKVGEGLANAGFSNHNIYELIESIWEDRYVTENGTGASLKNFARGKHLGASRVGRISQNFDEQIDNRLEEIILGDSKQKGKLIHDLADELKVGRKEMDDRVEILVGEMAKRINEDENRLPEERELYR